MRRPEGEPYTPLPRTLLILVGGIALIEAVLSLADAGLLASPGLRADAYRHGAFWSMLLRGQAPLFAAQPVTMFLSHALLHGGLLHMAMNMTILLALGRFMSDRYGSGSILPLFLAGAVGGAAAFGLISDTPFPMVGASGAVFAFLAAWTVWDWRRHRAAGAPVRPVVRRIAALVGINVLLWVGLGGGLAWEAHLGGFLAGLPLGLWFESRAAVRTRDRRAAMLRQMRGE